MSDVEITGELHLTKTTELTLTEQVVAQLRPVIAIINKNQERVLALVAAIEEVKQQNALQIETLAGQDSRLARLDYWKDSLFGNGTGVPRYLENVRREDNERIDGKFARLTEMIDGLQQAKYKAEGKSELLEDQEATRRAHELDSDQHKTHKWTRFHYALSAVVILLGSWFWSLVHPLAKVLVDHLIRAVQ